MGRGADRAKSPSRRQEKRSLRDGGGLLVRVLLPAPGLRVGVTTCATHCWFKFEKRKKKREERREKKKKRKKKILRDQYREKNLDKKRGEVESDGAYRRSHRLACHPVRPAQPPVRALGP